MSNVSLKDCVDTTCKKCSYVEGDAGSWRAQVEGCRGKSCKLFNVRPLTLTSKHLVRASRRDAIDAQCKQCIYDEGDKDARGTWRMQVRDCKSVECGLHACRPMPQIDVKEIT